MNSEIYVENGITVKTKPNCHIPLKSKPFLNKRMRVARESVLSCLAAFCKNQNLSEDSKLFCLDAFGATGLCGLQLKKHLADAVHVTISERDEKSFESLQESCLMNDFIAKDLPLNFSRIPGLPLEEQLPNEVHIKHCDAAVLLKMESFHFIYLDPFGCACPFLSSALSNIKNGGILYVNSTDVGALYMNHLQVVTRNYGVLAQKTEYMQEMAARVIITAIARAAALCNKGIQVLLCIAEEHFVSVAVHVFRGSKMADHSMQSIQRLLHCCVCDERVFVPLSSSVLVDACKLLPCDCHEINTGSTAMELGPMWCGNIFEEDFLASMKSFAVDSKLSLRCQHLLESLVQEAKYCTIIPMTKNNHGNSAFRSHVMSKSCSVNDEKEMKISKDYVEKTELDELDRHLRGKVNVTSTIIDADCNQVNAKCRSYADIEDKHSKSKTNTEECRKSDLNLKNSIEFDGDGKSRVFGRDCSEPTVKKCRLDADGHEESFNPIPVQRVITQPPFYYDLIRHCKKVGKQPKLSVVMQTLHRHGYRACRTNFCSVGLRTDCNLHQLLEILRQL